VIANFVIQMWSNPSQTVSKRNYFTTDKPETIYAASVTALSPGVTAESVSQELKLAASLDDITMLALAFNGPIK